MALSNSKKMYFNTNGINLNNWSNLLKKGSNADPEKFFKKTKNSNLRNSIFVDNTASANISKFYSNYLKKSISVVTCNKIACADEFENYKELKYLSKNYNAPFLFETNVGASLPIIDTLKNLILEIFISRIDNYMRTLPGEDRFRSLIVFDEAHRVKDNDQLEEFMRECRAFGFGVIFGTQLPKDLGPDIASHCASQISHSSSDYENRKTAVTAITGESRGQEFQDSLSNLQGFLQGQGYYRTRTKTEGLTYKSVKFLPYKEN